MLEEQYKNIVDRLEKIEQEAHDKGHFMVIFLLVLILLNTCERC